MRRHVFLTSAIVGISLALGACGGSSNKDASSSATAKANVAPIDELKAIPADLNADIADLTKPIDDTQNLIDSVTSFPTKYNVDAKTVMGMAQASMTNGTVDVKFDAASNVSDDAKAELTASLKKLADITTALKATPNKVAALTTKIATVTAKVPVLATRVTTEATFNASSPFASADMKAKAQANLNDVKTVQANVSQSISDAQSKVTGIPALATGALAKLTAAFAGSAKA
jgi:peptidoglycan hydrolase CwlO-like protein